MSNSNHWHSSKLSIPEFKNFVGVTIKVGDIVVYPVQNGMNIGKIVSVQENVYTYGNTRRVHVTPTILSASRYVSDNVQYQEHLKPYKRELKDCKNIFHLPNDVQLDGDQQELVDYLK